MVWLFDSEFGFFVFGRKYFDEQHLQIHPPKENRELSKFQNARFHNIIQYLIFTEYHTALGLKVRVNRSAHMSRVIEKNWVKLRPLHFFLEYTPSSEKKFGQVLLGL